MTRSWLPSLALLALALAAGHGCRSTTPSAPTAAPATGSEKVEAVEPGSPEPTDAAEPLLLAEQVGPDFDDQIEGERLRAEYSPSDPWMGAEEPTVTIVAFYDYQCPYSKRLMPRLYELVEAYPNEVRIVFKQFPLAIHRNAGVAARAAMGAQQQGRFWAMHDHLFDNQRALDRESVLAYGKAVGLDTLQLEGSLDDRDIDARVRSDFAQGTQLGVRGTPAMFFNGRLVSGAVDLDKLRTEVEAEIAASTRLLGAGAQRTALYAHFMHAAQPGETDAAKSTTAVTSQAEGERRAIDTEGLPRRGPADAPVQMVVCSDFDCPFCQRVGPTIDELLAEHPNDIAFYFRHLPLPFHKGAEPAARAAVAAQAQGKFWKMHDLLFENRQARSEDELVRLAKKAGLNTKKFRKVFRAAATAKRVAAEKDACTADGINGTPGFLINGRRLSGSRPLADFEAVIAEELAL